ncbi:type II toxin-antitoxin system prevent-host-death family antitoxin [Dermatophilaceae bacterium Sec6.4]
MWLTIRAGGYSWEQRRSVGLLRQKGGAPNAVVDDREEVVITRAGHDPVVIVSLDDCEALKESAYLLRSPANARRLLESIGRLENDDGVERELIE